MQVGMKIKDIARIGAALIKFGADDAMMTSQAPYIKKPCL